MFKANGLKLRTLGASVFICKAFYTGKKSHWEKKTTYNFNIYHSGVEKVNISDVNADNRNNAM